jgi:hypothetical protein
MVLSIPDTLSGPAIFQSAAAVDGTCHTDCVRRDKPRNTGRVGRHRQGIGKIGLLLRAQGGGLLVPLLQAGQREVLFDRSLFRRPKLKWRQPVPEEAATGRISRAEVSLRRAI